MIDHPRLAENLEWGLELWPSLDRWGPLRGQTLSVPQLLHIQKPTRKLLALQPRGLFTQQPHVSPEQVGGRGAAQKQDRPAHRWGRSLPPSRGPSRPGVSLRLGNAKGSVGIRDSAPPPPGPGSGFSCLLSSHHGPRGWTLAAFAPHSPEPSRGFGCPASHLSLGKGLPYRLPREAQPDGAGWGRRSLLGCLQFRGCPGSHGCNPLPQARGLGCSSTLTPSKRLSPGRGEGQGRDRSRCLLFRACLGRARQTRRPLHLLDPLEETQSPAPGGLRGAGGTALPWRDPISFNHRNPLPAPHPRPHSSGGPLWLSPG